MVNAQYIIIWLIQEQQPIRLPRVKFNIELELNSYSDPADHAMNIILAENGLSKCGEQTTLKKLNACQSSSYYEAD